MTVSVFPLEVLDSRLRGNDELKLSLATGEMRLQILHDFILVNLGTDSSHRIGKTPDDF